MEPERSMALYRIGQLVVLLVLAPFWYPIAKAMWKELYAALLPEGGLFGSPPTDIELQRLQQKLGDYEDPLVSEPWARNLQPQPRRDGKTGGGQAAARSGRGGGRAPVSSSARGFRSGRPRSR